MKVHRLELLTAEAFQGLGTVVAAHAGAGLQPVSGALACDGEASRPGLSLINLPPPVRPLRIERLERHPHAEQTFIPLGDNVGTVIACRSLPNGEPALDTLRAFLAGPGQVVTYRRGIWHHAAMACDKPTTVAMAMMHTQKGQDTEFFTVPAELELLIV